MVARTAPAQTARSRRTRNGLIDALRRELRARGEFHAADVAALAGCSEATFYSHFGDKDTALTAVFDAVLGDLVALTDDALALDSIRNRGLAAAVHDMVEAEAEFFRRETLVFRAALARLSRHRPLRDAYRRAEAATLASRRRMIVDGQREGLVRDGDPDSLAEALLVLGQGVNNPRVLRSGAAELRSLVGSAIVSLLDPAGT